MQAKLVENVAHASSRARCAPLVKKRRRTDLKRSKGFRDPKFDTRNTNIEDSRQFEGSWSGVLPAEIANYRTKKGKLLTIEDVMRKQGLLPLRPRLDKSENSYGTSVDYSLTPCRDLRLEEMNDVLDMPLYVQVARESTLNKVQDAIQQAYGREYTVEIFGSTRYGVSTLKSDLDMVVLDSKRKLGFPPGPTPRPKLPLIYDARHLARTLRKAGFMAVQPIPWASVPIVKLRDPKTNLRCDINVNERLGVANSDLIGEYCRLNPLLRPVLSFIKFWAKPLGLNEPSTKGVPSSFSSYALALMTIGLFQTRGQLPNLQASLPPLNPTSNMGVFWPEHPRDTKCDIRYNTDAVVVQPRQKLRGALQDWFEFWGREYQYDAEIVDIRLGGVQRSATVSKPGETSLPRQRLVVMDPFITKKSVTQSIGLATIENFQSHCKSAAEAISEGRELGKVAPGLARLLNRMKRGW